MYEGHDSNREQAVSEFKGEAYDLIKAKGTRGAHEVLIKSAEAVKMPKSLHDKILPNDEMRIANYLTKTWHLQKIGKNLDEIYNKNHTFWDNQLMA